jgi:threonine/homoserine/homoserine lactone efflux protein
MASDLSFIIPGIIFGLRSGLTPGPLLTLVISETLKHGIKEGLKIAIAPLLSDLPIVLITITVLSYLSDIRPVLGVISLLGGAFLVYLAYEGLSFRGADINSMDVAPQSVKKGVITNFLNPSPYLFWFSIGAPTVVKAMDLGLVSASLFIICFYVMLVGSKIAVAFAAGKSRNFLNSEYYLNTIRLLGIVMLIFALIFIKNGLKYLGLI